jgi:hypothetical protein
MDRVFAPPYAGDHAAYCGGGSRFGRAGSKPCLEERVKISDLGGESMVYWKRIESHINASIVTSEAEV